jgi:hypothetical protein
MRYRPLLNLNVSHAYYADGQCPDFQIEVTPETQRLLNNYRCIVKPFSHGLRILTAVDHDTPFIQFRKELIFAFQLVLRNPDFAMFTDLPEMARSAARLYINEQVNTTGPEPLKLVSRPRPSVPGRASQVFADVEIRYGDSVPDMTSGPATFQIAFQAKQTRWKYYLVTDTTTQPFRIVDQDKDAPIVFSNVQDLAQGLDSVAAALAGLYPKMRILRFISTSAIPCRQKTRKSLQLFVDTTQAMTNVPNPSLRSYTTDLEPGSLPGESCLFHVIKFFTYLSPTSGV